jgi:hypothetical protein
MLRGQCKSSSPYQPEHRNVHGNKMSWRQGGPRTLELSKGGLLHGGHFYSLNISKIESEVITQLSLDACCAVKYVVDKLTMHAVPPKFGPNSCSPDRSV